MCSGRSVNYALFFFIAIQLILCVIVLPHDRTLGASSSNSQSKREDSVVSNASRVTGRGRSSVRRRSRRRARTVTVDSARNIALNIPMIVTGQPITASANDNTPLDVTESYIQNRMMEYGAQSGYSGGEVIKRVVFADCSPPSAAENNNTMSTLTHGATPQSQTLDRCMSWDVAFKQDDASSTEVTRTSTIRLKDLNTDNGAVIRQGVIWLRTDPYRSITIVRPDMRTMIVEDEWWIDLHDEEVARRVARALQHAAQLCRGPSYVEQFIK